MNTRAKGELACLTVQQRALELGWLVSKPTTECRYDLVLDSGIELYRVQVKFCSARCLYLTRYNGRHNNIKERRRYTKDEVDAIIVLHEEELYWLTPHYFHDKTCATITDKVKSDTVW